MVMKSADGGDQIVSSESIRSGRLSRTNRGYEGYENSIHSQPRRPFNQTSSREVYPVVPVGLERASL